MRRNIIITGGELFNKGAQAMLFITVDELKKRYPEHEILVYSPMDLQRNSKELEIYAFRFIGWYPLKFAKAQNNPLLRLLLLIRSSSLLKECEAIYRNCDLMVDISGYALGSCWSERYCHSYLNNLEFAEKFHIPVYLLPQSFGPFDFFGHEGKKIIRRISHLLPKVKVILCREDEGMNDLIQTFHLSNVQKATDLVLNNKHINIENIYYDQPERVLPDIKKNSVAVITNNRLLECLDLESLLQMYRVVIDELLKLGESVYLINHSKNDESITLEIKKLYQDNVNVNVLSEDYSCLEFNELVKCFDFIVASRFHSLVHAFKNGIPCISLGWAEKYNDLMKQFEQDQYVYDLRKTISLDALRQSIPMIHANMNHEHDVIMSKIKDYQRENVFDILPKDL